MDRAELLEALGASLAYLQAEVRRQLGFSILPSSEVMEAQRSIGDLIARVKEQPEVLAEADLRTWKENPWGLHDGCKYHSEFPCAECIPVHVTISRQKEAADG